MQQLDEKEQIVTMISLHKGPLAFPTLFLHLLSEEK